VGFKYLPVGRFCLDAATGKSRRYLWAEAIIHDLHYFFTAGSFFCAIAPNIELLIIARLFQALGGGGIIPISIGIIAEQFPESRQQAIGLFASIPPIGQIIGPNIGGWMVDSFGWESIFWFNVPFGIFVLIVSFFILKSRKNEGGKMDLVGAGLFSGALCALMFALGELGNKNSSTWLVAVLLFVIAIVFIILFIRHEKRASNPIIDLQVLQEKPFIAANIFHFVFGVSILGVGALLPLYAVSVYKMTTLKSGLIITPKSIGAIAATIFTSVLLKRWGYRMPMLIGTAIVVICLVMLGVQLQSINIGSLKLDSMALVIIIMLVLGIGIGIVNPAANNACIELMPDRVSTISGVRGMFRQTGSALSISLSTLLLHNLGSMVTGFRVVFWGLAAILVISVPLIFMMPSAPVESISSSEI
jgi:EmrB/QacA subfamily drug resistance transporter